MKKKKKDSYCKFYKYLQNVNSLDQDKFKVFADNKIKFNSNDGFFFFFFDRVKIL